MSPAREFTSCGRVSDVWWIRSVRHVWRHVRRISSSGDGNGALWVVERERGGNDAPSSASPERGSSGRAGRRRSGWVRQCKAERGGGNDSTWNADSDPNPTAWDAGLRRHGWSVWSGHAPDVLCARGRVDGGVGPTHGREGGRIQSNTRISRTESLFWASLPSWTEPPTHSPPPRQSASPPPSPPPPPRGRRATIWKCRSATRAATVGDHSHVGGSTVWVDRGGWSKREQQRVRKHGERERVHERKRFGKQYGREQWTERTCRDPDGERQQRE